MKQSKSSICMLLALCMILAALAACSTESTDSTTPLTTPSDISNEEQTQQDDDFYNPDGSVKLPLADTVETVTVWMVYTSTVYESMNDLKWVEWCRDLTGVELKFQHPSSVSSTTEALTLMITSGNYPDVIVDADAYIGGGDKAIEDGVYLRLNDLVDKYMPNYSALRERGGMWKKMTISDNGNMWAIFGLTDTIEEPWTGLCIRTDYLNDLGIEIPVTLEDWHAALTRMKNEKNVEYPLSMPTSGLYFNSEFLSAFGVGKSFYQIDNKVQFGPIDPAAKKYVELMRQWYSEGLIDRDFLTRDTFGGGNYQDDTTLLATGQTVAGPFLWGFAGNNIYQRGMSEDPNIYFTGVKAPVQNVGDETRFGFISYPVKTAFAITTEAKNPVLICRLFDYFFSEEGSLFMNYGREGISYEFDSNGKIKMTDQFNEEVANAIYNNPWEETLRNYHWWDGPGLVDYTRIRLQYEDDSVLRDTCYIWAEMDTSYELPKVTLTPEEGDEYSAIMSDIQTYIQECFIKMITGSEPMDLFDTMIENIKTWDIDRAIEIQQAALDRYNAR